MKNVQRYRAMGSLCRQRAVFDPQNSWKHLGDAERWEHLAHAETPSIPGNARPMAQMVPAGPKIQRTRDRKRLPRPEHP